jgi:hypothetical protein
MAETDALPAPTNFPHRHLSSASDRPRRPPPGRTRLLAVEAILMEVGLLARSSAFVPWPDRGAAALRRSTTALLGRLRRRAIRSSGRGLAIIPGKSNRKEQRSCIPEIGRQRRVAENFFTTIRRYRRVNTRYDRLPEILMVFVSLESLDDWGRSWIGPPWLCLRDVPLDLRFLPFPCTPTSNSRKPCPNL